MASLSDDVAAYVESVMDGIEPARHSRGKLVREAVHGCVQFPNYCIALMDTPLIQRLRRVHQTSLASLTYPSAGHTRFEHTLGMAHNVSRMVTALRVKDIGLVGDAVERELMIAALMHDCGHGPFSHTCEEVIREYPEVAQEAETNPIFANSQGKPHEILSYYIVTSPRFVAFLLALEEEYHLSASDPGHIGRMIVGNMENPDHNGYIADIINGAFDADKLDYMARDSYFTGLHMAIDLERILYTLNVRQKPRRLCTEFSGVPNLEQILFNKLLLFSSMYHHHKVRTANCMVKDLVRLIRAKKITVRGRDLSRAADFLYLTDEDILAVGDRDPELAEYTHRIHNRHLYKRALVLSKRTVQRLDRNYSDLLALRRDGDGLLELRAEIATEAGCSRDDVLVDLPDAPSFREASQTFIKMPSGPEIALSKAFATDTWMSTYAEVKWQGHVFAPAALCESVGRAAMKVLAKRSVELSPNAMQECKLLAMPLPGTA